MDQSAIRFVRWSWVAGILLLAPGLHGPRRRRSHPPRPRCATVAGGCTGSFITRPTRFKTR